MSGQPYTVVVALTMPESPKNIELGMFMSCLQVLSTNPQKSNNGGIIRVAKNYLISNILPSHIQLFCYN